MIRPSLDPMIHSMITNALDSMLHDQLSKKVWKPWRSDIFNSPEGWEKLSWHRLSIFWHLFSSTWSRWSSTFRKLLLPNYTLTSPSRPSVPAEFPKTIATCRLSCRPFFPRNETHSKWQALFLVHKLKTSTRGSRKNHFSFGMRASKSEFISSTESFLFPLLLLSLFLLLRVIIPKREGKT